MKEAKEEEAGGGNLALTGHYGQASEQSCFKLIRKKCLFWMGPWVQGLQTAQVNYSCHLSSQPEASGECVNCRTVHSWPEVWQVVGELLSAIWLP